MNETTTEERNVKRCPTCGEEKPLDQFGSNKAKKDGLNVYCKECTRAKLRERYHADPEASRQALRKRYRANPSKYRKMKRLDYERKKLVSVAGKMLPWQAAEALGITEGMLHYLSQKHGISVAFVKPRWSDENEGELLLLRLQGLTHKAIAERTGRTADAVKMKLRELRNR